MTKRLKAASGTPLACAVILSTLAFGIMPANAAQPQILTPAATPLLPKIIYSIPYATFTPAVPGTTLPEYETIVTIDSVVTSTGVTCRFQVEWIDWNGVTVGVSGPAAAPGNGSFEYVTQPAPGTLFFPYDFNVFSNLTAPFEGYANVRTDCPSSTKAAVDAEYGIGSGFSTVMPVYKTILVIKSAGNNGD